MRGGKIVTQKIRDPLYTTFLKVFTKKIIFLKSEAPKALYSSHSFIVSALIRENSKKIRVSKWVTSTWCKSPFLQLLSLSRSLAFILRIGRSSTFSMTKVALTLDSTIFQVPLIPALVYARPMERSGDREVYKLAARMRMQLVRFPAGEACACENGPSFLA